ncbi:hypothetical protein [Microbulbifer epialgicus]|uniref:Uncharacterized protein n=1 Tax=Microbulbifer epialgicus TaxID=393907 RepID=A0ABV4NU49_9GAMM
MDNNTAEISEVINQMSRWPFAFMVAMMAMAILFMQGVWSTIAGLYFPYAYEVIVFPSVVYVVYQLYVASRSLQANTHKMIALLASFVGLFLPAFYLYASGQVDLHGMVFSDYSSELNHMPGASFLPFFFLAVLLSPIKTASIDQRQGTGGGE